MVQDPIRLDPKVIGQAEVLRDSAEERQKEGDDKCVVGVVEAVMIVVASHC